MNMAINWKKYPSDKTYDEYVTNDHVLRREAKIISKILNKKIKPSISALHST